MHIVSCWFFCYCKTFGKKDKCVSIWRKTCHSRNTQAWDRLWLVYYCLFRIAQVGFPGFFPQHLHRSCRTNSLPWQNVSMQELGAQRNLHVSWWFQPVAGWSDRPFVDVLRMESLNPTGIHRVPGEKITMKFIQVTMLQRQCETDRPGSTSIFGGVSVESWVKDLGEIPWNTPEWTMWEWW